ncbi:hypothetical protein HNQ80_005045 [Anaerosolibacter carboniphilus]|uniref:Uncharacterized protein n=1 Tax=Anaerosolibacter carboniphilus TaxID=1417629 RepID=A0A841L3X3_9FIRM|nr:hypothetical protein [Anaerosolibacter carboniphilus]
MEKADNKNFLILKKVSVTFFLYINVYITTGYMMKFF